MAFDDAENRRVRPIPSASVRTVMLVYPTLCPESGWVKRVHLAVGYVRCSDGTLRRRIRLAWRVPTRTCPPRVRLSVDPPKNPWGAQYRSAYPHETTGPQRSG